MEKEIGRKKVKKHANGKTNGKRKRTFCNSGKNPLKSFLAIYLPIVYIGNLGLISQYNELAIRWFCQCVGSNKQDIKYIKRFFA